MPHISDFRLGTGRAIGHSRAIDLLGPVPTLPGLAMLVDELIVRVRAPGVPVDSVPIAGRIVIHNASFVMELTLSSRDRHDSVSREGSKPGASPTSATASEAQTSIPRTVCTQEFSPESPYSGRTHRVRRKHLLRLSSIVVGVRAHRESAFRRAIDHGKGKTIAANPLDSR